MRFSADPPEPGTTDTKGSGERGQTLVEYSLILLLIVLVTIPALLLVWPALAPGFQTVINTIVG
jgi:hypothetical protein